MDAHKTSLYINLHVRSVLSLEYIQIVFSRRSLYLSSLDRDGDTKLDDIN